MMKNYPLRSKPNRTNAKKVVTIVSLFLFLALILYLLPNTISSTGRTLSRPIWYVGSLVASSFSRSVSFFSSRNNLISKNTALEEEINSLKLKETDYGILLKENQDLKSELGRPGVSGKVLASILSKPPVSPFDTFVIDIGSSLGIKEGNKVYLGGNIIVGKVKSVTGGTSIVELFSNSSVKQESTLSRTGATFVLQGHGGANFILEVPKEADILWGDVFTYPDINSSIIGTVYYIDTNSQSSFKTIYLRIPGNVFSARYLFVEKSIF